jgi:hypothetical protein
MVRCSRQMGSKGVQVKASAFPSPYSRKALLVAASNGLVPFETR